MPALFGNAALAVLMIGLLRPAATLLPYHRALALARSIGAVSAAIPYYGRAKASQFQRAFGHDIDVKETRQLAAEYLARPLCDFVVLRRVLRRGWADFDKWRIEQRSTACADALRASNESFILATGHFSRQACMPFYRPEILSQTIISIVHPRTKRTWNPYTWWLSYHYGQMLDGVRWARPGMQFVNPGETGVYRRVLETLKRPGNVVLVYADARPRHGSGSYIRSFAGLKARPFATGAARLSRMTGRPIAVCIPYLVDERTIVLDWTRVIPPSAERDHESDMAVTNLILDDIEKAIGRRPGQYVQDYLGERRWKARAEQWM